MGEIVAQSVGVAVEPNILEWALSRAGMDVASLPEKKSRRVAKWFAQEEQPTLRQLESFAATTMAPLGYFFLKEPPEEQLPVPDFTTVRDTGLRQPSPNLLETIYMMQRRQAWLRGQSRAGFVLCRERRRECHEQLREVNAMGRCQSALYGRGEAGVRWRGRGWLVAFAMSQHGCRLVTFEKPNPARKTKVPIPSLCDAFGVKYCTPFDMLRTFKIKFDWNP